MQYSDELNTLTKFKGCMTNTGKYDFKRALHRMIPTNSTYFEPALNCMFAEILASNLDCFEVFFFHRRSQNVR